MKNRGKIAVAMSGGVDSSVAALLLKKDGCDVTGINLNLWACHKGSGVKTCCGPEDRRDARAVCEVIGIPFHCVDMRDEFREKVIINFVREYTNGRTPNPCIRCNTWIKFGSLMTWAQETLGIELLATGHYARILKSSGLSQSKSKLAKAADSSKDQSYFLFDIKPETFNHLRFPLGELSKKEVRRIAESAQLPVAEKQESQEVCFVPDGDVASFIEDYYPGYARPEGRFVDSEGRELGKHRGTHAFTIGQRRGLGIGFGRRRYVKEIRAETGEVVLGDGHELSVSSCLLEGVNLHERPGDIFTAEIKIRYASPPVSGEVRLSGGGRADINFLEPVRAVTPGQAAVFYKGDIVLGGGWIV